MWLLSLCPKNRGEQQKFSLICVIISSYSFILLSKALMSPCPSPDQPLVLLLGLMWGTRDEPFLSGSSFAPQAAEFGADQEMTPSSPGTSGWGPQLCVREG